MTKNQSLYVVLAAIIALLVGEFMGYHFTTPAELIIQNYPLDLS